MSSVEETFNLFNPMLFASASLRLERCLKEVWRHDTQDNHNQVVGAINTMIRHATEEGKDETDAHNKFDRIVLDLEKRGYTNISELEFKEFREYLDKDGNPYE